MAEVVATAPDPVEAPDECIAIYGADGTPSDRFVVCDSATSTARRKAIADPVNALALAAPRLLPAVALRTVNGNLAVRPKVQFEAAFAKLTGNAFRNFTAADWANCVVAGGAVVACLTCDNNTSPNTDVDIFLYGLDETAARRKIDSLFATLKRAESTALALRTPHTITVVLPYPKRIVQIILNLHQAAPNVVNVFDVDVCGCYYDGKDVHATRRCARAFATRTNLAVPFRRSYLYETRLIKYAKRGFSIGVPGLREADVQLKKRLPVRKCVTELPEDHSKYYGGKYGDPGYDFHEAYERVDVGFEYKFDGEGEGYGGLTDEPGMFDYMGAKGCRKLLIANAAGRAQFKKEGRRTKFIFHCRDTMALAEFLMAMDDPYGPSTPDVPGAHKYSIAPNITQYTGGPLSGENGCTFVDGPIKTGTAAGFDESTWFDECYIPMTD